MNELEIFFKDGTSIIAGYEKSDEATKRAAETLVRFYNGGFTFLFTDTHVVATDCIKYLTFLDKE